MNCRKSVAQLTSQEKADYVGAVLALKKAPSLIPAAQTAITNAGGAPNRYDDYVWMHNVLGTGGHRGPAFGPWHREFLRQFELDLRKVANNPAISIPYWDWTVDQTPTAAGWPFTNDFMGGFGTPGGSFEVTTGPFSDPGTATTPGPWRCHLTRVQVTQTGFITLGPRLKRSPGVLAPAGLPNRSTVVGTATVASPLTIGVYDTTPYHDFGTPQPTVTQIRASFRKVLERFLHDGVHVWIGNIVTDVNDVPTDGGNMSFPPVAVNDPIFFLHHANVDRLWAIWQQRNPTLGYAPASGANSGHNAGDVMARFADASHFAFPLAPGTTDGLDWHARGVWYRSDLPEIQPVSLSIDFGQVPEGLTTHRPAQFEVATCQRVKFRVTAVSGGGYSIPAGQGTVSVEHSETADTVTGNVYLAFAATAPGGGPVAGSATIEAFIDDADGYFAPTVNGEFVVGTWTVNMTAAAVPRPRSAITLVLDRSGSMSESAGPNGTKYDLLRSSLQVTADLMSPDDAIALVGYDSGTQPPFGVPDGVKTLAPVTAMGAVSPPGAGRGAVTAAIASPDLVPRGGTAIGQGMIQGASVLNAERLAAGTPYSRHAMVVMTDGNENIPPVVTSAAVAGAVSGFASSVYAIGLGSETGVSATTLGAIARYMLITGDITTAERRFRLTKYFVQIIADVTNTAIVVDPQGDLHLGVTHEIPFLLTEADVAADVIALSPGAPLLDMRLVAPDGTVVTPATASPNVAFVQGREDAYYRMGLPAVPGVSGTHAGEWRAVLQISRRGGAGIGLSSHGLSDDGVAKALSRTGTLPYSLLVQSRSNLALTAEAAPGVVAPGGTATLLATLREYDVLMDRRAGVVVDVTEPTGTVTVVPLAEVSAGVFEGQLRTRMQGVHVCRFRASGVTLAGRRFSREATRTVAATVPPPTPPPGGPGDAGDTERLCRLLACLIDRGGLARLLERNDVDPDAVRACLKAFCGHQRGKGEVVR